MDVRLDRMAPTLRDSLRTVAGRTGVPAVYWNSIERLPRMDDLSDTLRGTSRWLWRIADSIDAYNDRSNDRSAPSGPPRRSSAPLVAFCGGMLAGIGLMYLMDADAGRRHRALVRDQMTHYSRVAGRGLDGRRRDLGNRMRGVVMERIKHMRDQAIDDAILVERIRAHMGHLLSHAETRRIEVSVKDGQVTLSGDVVASHVNRVLGHVATVPGVHALATDLTVHPSLEDMLGSQRASRRSNRHMETAQPDAGEASMSGDEQAQMEADQHMMPGD